MFGVHIFFLFSLLLNITSPVIIFFLPGSFLISRKVAIGDARRPEGIHLGGSLISGTGGQK